MIKRHHFLGALLLFGLCIFLGLNWHSHTAKFTYHSEIWADRAGYHVYLPATFDYHFDPNAFPKGIDLRTGNGFYLDSIPGRVITKYPCGEAILRTPFYLLGKLLRAKDDPAGAGFTLIDHAMIDVSASFYGVLGLLLLFLVLRKQVTDSVAAASVFAILTGTNMLFYLIGDPGMSHVYSFFLFTAFIFVHERIIRSGPTTRRSLVLGLLIGLIAVTRPINILVIPFAVAITASTWAEMVVRFRALCQLRIATLVVIGAVVMSIPQMAYWQYAFGSPIKWSYGHEGFTHLLDPEVVPFWFAPENGLFTYSPLILLVLVTVVWRFRSTRVATGITWLTFLLMSYISASWFTWAYGCGFGSRNFVEYGVVFAFPLANLLQAGSRRRWIIGTLVALCCLYTLKLTFSYPTCWFGSTWDWPRFVDLLTGPTL